MFIKRTILKILDSLRSFIMKSMNDNEDTNKPKSSQKYDYTKQSSYCEDDSEILVVVNREKMAAVLMFAIVASRLGRLNFDEVDPSINIITTTISMNESGGVMFTGDISLGDFLELANDCEVGHILDAMTGSNVCIKYADEHD